MRSFADLHQVGDDETDETLIGGSGRMARASSGDRADEAMIALASMRSKL